MRRLCCSRAARSSRPRALAEGVSFSAEALANAAGWICGDILSSRLRLAISYFGCRITRKSRGRGTLKALETSLLDVDSGKRCFSRARNHFSQWLRARTEFARGAEAAAAEGV